MRRQRIGDCPRGGGFHSRERIEGSRDIVFASTSDLRDAQQLLDGGAADLGRARALRIEVEAEDGARRIDRPGTFSKQRVEGCRPGAETLRAAISPSLTSMSRRCVALMASRADCRRPMAAAPSGRGLDGGAVHDDASPIGQRFAAGSVSGAALYPAGGTATPGVDEGHVIAPDIALHGIIGWPSGVVPGEKTKSAQ